jgi:ubiquitin carboxyl-terminal hydrolase 4/11/15
MGSRVSSLRNLQPLSDDTWSIPQHPTNPRLSLPSPITDELPGFEESQSHELILGMSDDNNIDPLLLASERYDVSGPDGLDDDDGDAERYGNMSPSSSLEAEADEEENWDAMRSFDGRHSRGVSPGGSQSWQSASASGMGSPLELSEDDGSPFGDSNVQKTHTDGHDETDMDSVDSHEKTA